MSMEPKLLERRKTVAEDRAKRNLGKLLRFLAALFAVASVLWILLSPWLSVHQVRTAGVEASDAHGILAREGVVTGTPMIMVRTGAVERSLAADPWISEARVWREWPNEVVVVVGERVPMAWVETGGGWSRRSLDGVALPSASEPDGSLPRVSLPQVNGREAAGSPLVLGALEFLSRISPDRRPDVEVSLRGDELWAEVDGLFVQLGRPVDMAEKGLSLEALLVEDLAEGSTVVLIAPTHPAVRPPEWEEEQHSGESEGDHDDSNDEVEP